MTQDQIRKMRKLEDRDTSTNTTATPLVVSNQDSQITTADIQILMNLFSHPFYCQGYDAS